MCRLFAQLDSRLYASETRSVRLGGHATSIRLENAFWTVLEEIAAEQDVTLGRFLTTLYDEMLEMRGEVTNFASLLRCACLTYAGNVRAHPAAQRTLSEAAARDFAAAVEATS
jgi:predicted DNA-binding ribbon-helix-helix protein